MKQYKYTVKGTILGSRRYEDYTEDMTPEEMVEYMEEISTLFLRDPEDELAQYIQETVKETASFMGLSQKSGLELRI
jgi:hypothetical protein